MLPPLLGVFLLALAGLFSLAPSLDAATLVTDSANYQAGSRVLIEGEQFLSGETVHLRVTFADGSALPEGTLDYWTVNAIGVPSGTDGDVIDAEDQVDDHLKGFLTYWFVPETLDDAVLKVVATGGSSGYIAAAYFYAAKTILHQLSNGTTTVGPEWQNGNVNTSNSCYSEGNMVPYRFYIKDLDANTDHYFIIQTEATKSTLHALDYLTQYDISESDPIAGAGGPCGTITQPPPADCMTPTAVAAFPDPRVLASYSAPPPSEVAAIVNPAFPITGPGQLYAYNVTNVTFGLYYYTGTASNWHLNVVVSFRVVDNGSVGFYWGGHLAEGRPDGWGLGQGAGSISGAPYHMSAGTVDGQGGMSDRSVNRGTICLPPDATITCDPGQVCTGGSHSCSAATGASTYEWTVTGGTITSGQGTATIVYQVTASPGQNVTVSLVACNTNEGGCPGDNCCDQDQVVLTAENCCDVVITCPPDLTVACDESLDPSNTGTATFTASGPGCPSLSVTYVDTQIPGGCPQEMVIDRTWKVVDAYGTIFAQCTQTITVVDDVAPVLSGCPSDVTVSCDAIPSPAMVTATDNCDLTPTVTLNTATTPGSCPQEYVLTRTWTAADDCGNSSQCSQAITVVDDTPPVLAGCPSNVTVECDAVPAPANVTATDNCDATPTVSYNQTSAPGSCPQEYVLTRTWTATDDCGNQAQCSQTITVVDNTAPVLVGCPADVTVECDAVPAPASVTATDNCDPTPTVGFSQTITPGACPQEYTITRTWTATDACGNQVQCVQVITVDDTVPPQITSCPGTVSVQCPTDVPAPNIGLVSATDNCDASPTIVFLSDVSDGQSCPETITRTYKASDDCGNYSLCVQTIIIDDTTPPQITCPANVTIYCDESSDPSNTGYATASDNCTAVGSIVITYSDQGGSGSISRTWTATDECGNQASCVQTLTVGGDVENPVITCPGPVSVECLGDVPAPDIGSVTVTDNCDPNPAVTHMGDSQSGSCPVTITRTYRATDNAGNWAECTQTITVDDNTAPTLVGCPSAVTVECDNIPAPANVTATDNCDLTPTVTLSATTIPGSCPQEYTLTRTWTGVDACGNSSQCSQVITVVDNTAPVLVGCPPNITVDCDAVPAPATVTATDNCDPAPSVAYNQTSTSGTCPQEYVLTRTWTATDACGNQAQCSQQITVTDDDPPTVTCPAPIAVECLSDVPAPNPSLVSATDNCDPTPTVSWVSDVPDGASCPLTITRTYKGVDDCGNIGYCTQLITVDDQTPPVLAGCPSNVTVECNSIPGAANVTATDNCDPNPVVTFAEVVTPGDCPANYTITRTWTATDDCGNQSSCSQVITVRDTTPPQIITCPGAIAVECDSEIPAPNLSLVDAIDNCDPAPSVAFVSDVSDGQTCPKTITRTYRVTDDCGNFADCQQTITVDDQTPPELTCPAPLTVDCMGDVPAPNFGELSVTDNCDASPTLSHVSDVPDGLICPLTITRTYRAEDDCGNWTTCTQSILVDDRTPPDLTGCPQPLVQLSCQQPLPPVASVTAYDNCDGVLTVDYDQIEIASGQCPVISTIIRTWTATDACGNVAQCQQTIEIRDTDTPRFSNVPADVTINCDDPLPPRVDPQVADSCDASPDVVFAQTETPGQCPQERIVTRTWTATDFCDHSASVGQTITVVDDEPPVCTVPADASFTLCQPEQICLPVGCADACDPLPTASVVGGPGAIVGGQWCYTPTGSGSFDITIRCEDHCGNYCEAGFHVEVTINRPPQITNCPTQNTIAHWGDVFSYDIDATDPDPDETLTYSLCAGAPQSLTINSATGVIQWQTTRVDICDGDICVIVADECQIADTCQFHVDVVNDPPVLTCPDAVTICYGDSYEGQVTVEDTDHGPWGPYFYLYSGPSGVQVDVNTGAISWPEPTPGTHEICILATDSAATCEASPSNADSCCFILDVRALDVKIEKVHDQFQGQYAEISIDFLYDFNWPVAGFDLLIQYDASALSFIKAVEGEFFTDCGWEFFTYRFGPSGNCAGGACPSGVLRVVAMAEGIGGNLANHPDCFDNDGTSEPGPGPNSTTANQLAVLTFMVTNDRTFECQFVPIRFAWYDCGDNSFSSVSGDTLHISNRVFDYAGDEGEPPVPIWTEITGLDALMPTVTGAPSPECDLSDKFALVRCANFYNGGVDIICADSIDAPGDINLNGIAYEIADAVMFTNYFINGTTAFQPHVDGSIAASDVNHDGMPLTVADLVYTIRVVIGDAFPYPKQAPVAGAYSVDEGVVTVADGLALGGAALVVKGEVHPDLLAAGVDMVYRFDGDNTRIVVVPDVNGTSMTSFSGAFLGGIRGEILAIDLATPDGVRVTAKNVPARYALSQNYPNPFNASTTFEFALPEAGRFELTVFNIQGQAVHTYSGLAETPGVYRYTWDAGDLASGVYLYRLWSGEFGATKKLLLLK